MEQRHSSVRQADKYRLTPTPAQGQALEWVLSRGWMLYNVAVEQRKPWWRRGRRADFYHTTALAHIRANDTVSHEDAQTANMVRNQRLAKRISDAGWSQFLVILCAKAAFAGRRVIAAPPAFTSHRCSGCGILAQQGFSVRWHARPDCGTSLQRDQNGALNIQRLGQQLKRRQDRDGRIWPLWEAQQRPRRRTEQPSASAVVSMSRKAVPHVC
jgi:transposase